MENIDSNITDLAKKKTGNELGLRMPIKYVKYIKFRITNTTILFRLSILYRCIRNLQSAFTGILKIAKQTRINIISF